MSNPSQSATPDDTLAKIDKALQHVYDICQGREKWTMRVPADVERDSDLILCEALESARKALAVRSESAATPVGLFWQAADGRLHFCEGAFKRGDIHDNGRPIRIALLGEEAP